MEAPNPLSQLRKAIDSEHPFKEALKLATKLRDQKVSQEALTHLYMEELALHRDAPDEKKYDALADTLDFITGWCSPSNALYPAAE